MNDSSVPSSDSMNAIPRRTKPLASIETMLVNVNRHLVIAAASSVASADFSSFSNAFFNVDVLFL